MKFMKYFLVLAILSVGVAWADEAAKTDSVCPATKAECDKAASCQKSEAKGCPVSQDDKAVCCADKAPSDELAVIVNGTKITEGEVDSQVDEMMNRASRPGMNDEQKAKMREQARKRALEMMIDDALLSQAAAKAKVELTDAEISAKIDEMVDMTLKSRNMTREQLDEQLRQSPLKMGLDEQIEKIKVDPMFRSRVMQEKLVRAENADALAVSDADIAAAYEKMASRFSQPEQVRASHILFKFEDGATDEQKAELMKKAEEALVKAKAEDADFAALAKEYSGCPSSQNGGDLNFFAKERMVPEFSEAAFAMKVGDISDIVETQFGYHIIKVTDRKEAATQTLDEVKDELKGELEMRNLQTAVQGYMDKLKADAKVVYPEGKSPEAAQAVPVAPAPVKAEDAPKAEEKVEKP